MKKAIYLLFLLVAAFSCANKPSTLNVMTFNIRYDNPDDSLNNWQYRKDVVAQTIRTHNVDLLGAQEVLVNQLNDMKERLPEYGVIGVGRADGMEKGEYSPIFYNKERFVADTSGCFWLSETPEIAGSKGWDGACERIATWAILTDKISGKQLFFMNTHLDHVGKTARREGVKLLRNKAEKLGRDLPVIITGDFNAAPHSGVIGYITENGIFQDSRFIADLVSGGNGTFHDFGRIPEEERELIDYVLVTDNVKVEHYQVLPDKLEDIYVSDHAPVWAKIKLN